MEWFTDPQTWVALATLTALEVVLGIDNIVFISVLTGRLPVEQQARARRTGLMLAVVTRILLLLSLSWLIGLTKPLFVVWGEEVSGRDLILLAGGLFLIAKSTHEIHNKLEGVEVDHIEAATATFATVIAQIMLLDVVFSLDSVITAIGMAEKIGVMIAAVVIAIGVMIVFAEPVSRFVETRPTIKMLALSFLLLIGVTLIAEGMDLHIPKGYVYFAMAFSLFVELLNLRLRSQSQPVQLRGPHLVAQAPVGEAREDRL